QKNIIKTSDKKILYLSIGGYKRFVDFSNSVGNMALWAGMFKVSLFNHVIYTIANQRVREDVIIHSQLIRYIHSAVQLPYKLYFYRQNPDESNSNYKALTLDIFKQYLAAFDFVLTEAKSKKIDITEEINQTIVYEIMNELAKTLDHKGKLNKDVISATQNKLKELLKLNLKLPAKTKFSAKLYIISPNLYKIYRKL
ncbi:MAG: hypothetical protein LBM13_03040, partial [Candidatus Ancillula sp.]|nr:hypothetical protein [Candidatus Ancillula sp.]